MNNNLTDYITVINKFKSKIKKVLNNLEESHFLKLFRNNKYVNQISSSLCVINNLLVEQQQKIEALDRMMKQTTIKLRQQEEYNKQLKVKSSATARQLMKLKWQDIDEKCIREENVDDLVICKICNYQSTRKNFKTEEADCKFNGGKLVRYTCPGCGVIFGPTKFSSLSQSEINDDYITHYLGFSEGDSTNKELDAFYLLQPEKDKLYLNYGCGCWSESMKILSEQGYQIFGYEPYAMEADNPLIITNRETIIKMKFDGIYSNDLIEHLIDPVKEFQFMKSLLKDKKSIMSHSTSCYIYKHVDTRFHTHFFTGKSLEVLCDRAGFEIINRVNMVDQKDFICYVYKPININMDYTMQMKGISKENDDWILHSESVMYGPYITLGGNNCIVLLDIDFDDSKITDLKCSITEKAGKETLEIFQLSKGENVMNIKFSGIIYDMEFVVINNSKEKIIIHKVEILE